MKSKLNQTSLQQSSKNLKKKLLHSLHSLLSKLNIPTSSSVLFFQTQTFIQTQSNIFCMGGHFKEVFPPVLTTSLWYYILRASCNFYFQWCFGEKRPLNYRSVMSLVSSQGGGEEVRWRETTLTERLPGIVLGEIKINLRNMQYSTNWIKIIFLA